MDYNPDHSNDHNPVYIVLGQLLSTRINGSYIAWSLLITASARMLFLLTPTQHTCSSSFVPLSRASHSQLSKEPTPLFFIFFFVLPAQAYWEVTGQEQKL